MIKAELVKCHDKQIAYNKTVFFHYFKRTDFSTLGTAPHQNMYFVSHMINHSRRGAKLACTWQLFFVTHNFKKRPIWHWNRTLSIELWQVSLGVQSVKNMLMRFIYKLEALFVWCSGILFSKNMQGW